MLAPPTCCAWAPRVSPYPLQARQSASPLGMGRCFRLWMWYRYASTWYRSRQAEQNRDRPPPRSIEHQPRHMLGIDPLRLRRTITATRKICKNASVRCDWVPSSGRTAIRDCGDLGAFGGGRGSTTSHAADCRRAIVRLPIRGHYCMIGRRGRMIVGGRPLCPCDSYRMGCRDARRNGA